MLLARYTLPFTSRSAALSLLLCKCFHELTHTEDRLGSLFHVHGTILNKAHTNACSIDVITWLEILVLNLTEVSWILGKEDALWTVALC